MTSYYERLGSPVRGPPDISYRDALRGRSDFYNTNQKPESVLHLPSDSFRDYQIPGERRGRGRGRPRPSRPPRGRSFAGRTDDPHDDDQPIDETPYNNYLARKTKAGGDTKILVLSDNAFKVLEHEMEALTLGKRQGKNKYTDPYMEDVELELLRIVRVAKRRQEYEELQKELREGPPQRHRQRDAQTPICWIELPSQARKEEERTRGDQPDNKEEPGSEKTEARPNSNKEEGVKAAMD